VSGRLVLVDPPGRDRSRSAGAALVKPKLSGLASVLGEPVERWTSARSRAAPTRPARASAGATSCSRGGDA